MNRKNSCGSKSKKRWEGCTYCSANLARERVDERPHEEEDDVNGEEAGDGRPQLPGDHLRLQQRGGETDLICPGLIPITERET